MANVPISAFTVGANTTGIGASGYSLTGSAANSYIDLAGTWNTSGTPTAIKLNITDTASNANSLLLDLQTGGTSRFRVTKAGAVAYDGLGDINFFIQNGTTLLRSANSASSLHAAGGMSASSAFTAQIDTGGSTGHFRATSGNAVTTYFQLFGEAADTLAQRRTTNAQTFRIYNTFTDASNYERGKIEWASNVLRIGTEKAGTGTARALEFQTDGTTRLTIDTTGNATFSNRVYINSASTFLESDTSQLYAVIAGRRAVSVRQTTNFSFSSENGLSWASSTDATGGTIDLRISKTAATILRLGGNADSTAGGAMEFLEMTAPAAPAANQVRIYAQDNGSGKTRLMALFATGAAQQLAIEP